MAALTQDELLEAIDKMTVLELSEFIKRFEERYGVTAAAPAAAAAAPAAGGGAAGGRGRSRGADRVHRDPDRDRAQQDPGHQGRPRADRPRPQGGQGPRRRLAQGRQGRRHQGRGREDQGRARGAGRQGRDQVTRSRPAAGRRIRALPRSATRSRTFRCARVACSRCAFGCTRPTAGFALLTTFPGSRTWSDRPDGRRWASLQPKRPHYQTGAI